MDFFSVFLNSKKSLLNIIGSSAEASRAHELTSTLLHTSTAASCQSQSAHPAMKHEGSQPGRPSAPRPTSRGSERSQSQQAQLVEGGSGAQAQARAHPNYGGVEEASDRWLEHRRRSHPTNLFAKATGEGASHGRNAFSGPLTPPRTGRDKDRDQDGHRRQARELPSPSTSITQRQVAAT